MKVIDKYGREVDAKYIDKQGCHNNGEYICNLGYACDGCPYNINLEKEHGKLDNCPYCGKALVGESRTLLFKGKRRILYCCKYCGMPYYVVMPKTFRIEWMIQRIGRGRKGRNILARVNFRDGEEEILEYMELERVKDVVTPCRN